MKYRKITLNKWFSHSFHCVYEDNEFDETVQVWTNPVNVLEVYSRRIEYDETR
jgi:hypothetical protein